MIGEFSRERLKDTRYGILYDFNPESEVLFMCYSGTGLDQVPPFEFSGVLRNYNINKIFVRDVENYSYHNGLKGIGKNIDDAADSIRELIELSGAKKIVSVGNCQGGYAATLFGILCGAPEVLAFAPLTFLDPENRIKYGETRWIDEYRKIYTSPNRQPEYYDLTKVPGFEKTRMLVYCDYEYRLDRIHTERLEPFKNVEIFPRNGGAHLMVRNLKKSGELDEILSQAASPKLV